jgi:hypothetical protein
MPVLTFTTEKKRSRPTAFEISLASKIETSMSHKSRPTLTQIIINNHNGLGLLRAKDGPPLSLKLLGDEAGKHRG